MDLIWDPHPSPFAKRLGSPRSYCLANCSGAESWVEGLSSWIPHYTGAAMLTARPTPTPGREAGLDPGPAPGGERCSPWSRDLVPHHLFLPRSNISHVFSHLPTPSFVPVRWSFPTSGKATAEGLPQSYRCQSPNSAQLLETPVILLLTPTTTLPLIAPSFAFHLLSLHLSLPAQRPQPHGPRSFPPPHHPDCMLAPRLRPGRNSETVQD